MKKTGKSLGPMRGMAAKKIEESKIAMSDFWLADTVLNAPVRFVTFQQLVKRLYIDGIASIQFQAYPRPVATNTASKTA